MKNSIVMVLAGLTLASAAHANWICKYNCKLDASHGNCEGQAFIKIDEKHGVKDLHSAEVMCSGWLSQDLTAVERGDESKRIKCSNNVVGAPWNPDFLGGRNDDKSQHCTLAKAFDGSKDWP
ncbi:MAG: hypothetical protein JNL01_09365 [Bdellovibrionales bacterium]|nr:hypothetical protein [Bdellovibrionales bacterium]